MIGVWNPRVIKRLFIYLFLTAAAFVSVFPFYWMVVSSTNPSIEVTRGRFLPGNYLLENMQSLLATVDILQAMWNSFIVAVASTLLTLLISSLAGYGFEIYRSRAKDMLFNILLASMMLPFAALMVPLYRMFGKITNVAPAIGIDTLTAVVLPTMTTAFFIFFFRQNTKLFSRELLEAGRIDGLSEFGLFLRIYVPTMRSTYAAAAIIAFMTSWNNYMWPLIVLQTPQNRTVPLLISLLGSSYMPDYGVIMLAIVITTIPTALVFFFMQKHFVAGMIGTVK